MIRKLLSKESALALVGLGYVGLPIAVAFSKYVRTIGFDNNEAKVALYKKGIDPTKEVGNQGVKDCSVDFTADPNRLKEASFIIVAVPTPVKDDHTPDLSPVVGASKIVGRNLSKGAIVCFESTVYPGVTEDVCVPILERESGLKCGSDFKVAYSPERINPGDKVHRLESIIKVVSGMDQDTLETVAAVYSLVVKAGVYKADSIKVAEAAKVIENSQRDINIAFMNELAMIFNRLGIDTKSVLDAAGTKWNFLKFQPGLVGGHCIGVDPYYLTYKAENVGYHSQIILAGRRINDDMGSYVANTIVKKMVANNNRIKGAKIAVLGFTFKENCPDTRNTKVIDIVNELKEYGCEVIVSDAEADPNELRQHYGIEMTPFEKISNVDVVILAVKHNVYMDLNFEKIRSFYGIEHGERYLLADLKAMLNKDEAGNNGFDYWRL